MRVSPEDLVIAENARKTFNLDDHPELRDSIREFGVEIPLIVERQLDGALHVVDGQLRTLTSLAVGTPDVDIWVTDVDPNESESERRIRITLMQMNVNHRRVPMTTADDAAGIALMLDLGASVTRVATGLQRSRTQVKKQAAIAASPTAKSLVDSSNFNLDQLAILAEFERLGDTDAVTRLRDAGAFNFTYRAKTIAYDRQAVRARLQASVLYAALEFGILSAEPDTSSTPPQFIPAELLETDSGEAVGEDLIRGDAARWVVWVDVQAEAELADRETGEVIDPDTVDPDTRGHSDAQPRSGLRHADTVIRRDRWMPSYYLLADQLPGSGLRFRARASGASGDSSVAEVEQAMVAAAAERELARLQRRRVRVLNTRGSAANERRQEFLARLLKRRTPPAQAAAFVAESLARYPDLLSSSGASWLGHELFGASDLADTAATATPQRAQIITLGLVLAAYESRAEKTLWRSPGRLPRYLAFLAEVGAPLGFELVDVEQAAAGLIDYHDIDIATAA
ncbi:ParB family chromosome partitioning protein [Nocardia sp. GAS34]|uniref:ParB/RepB/Spo0J family partition protein n=1 Tax=unclassified Nocardia TaxID=2637762 RepID=UPI003D239572